jgi:hypothetical protein
MTNTCITATTNNVLSDFIKVQKQQVQDTKALDALLKLIYSYHITHW